MIICDIDGFEDQLLDPAKAPALCKADLLIELHDVFVPGVTARLKTRFAPTHTWELVSSAEPDPARYPMLDYLPHDQRKLALAELRNGPQDWALLKIIPTARA